MPKQNRIEKTLDRLGLWKAIRGIPGLMAIVILSVALTEFALSQFQALARLPTDVFHLVGTVFGALLGLLGYYLGNFWDSIAFDPLYGRDGRWIDRKTRPLHLFPAGADLRRYRERAIEAIFPPGHSGEGVYREAESRAKQRPSQWQKVEGPLILSKFTRSLIWPCVLLAVVSLVSGGRTLLLSAQSKLPGELVFCLAAAILGLALFVPYFNLRVEHMIRLYQSVSNEGAKGRELRNA